jgi:hypothetical protein
LVEIEDKQTRKMKQPKANNPRRHTMMFPIARIRLASAPNFRPPLLTMTCCCALVVLLLLRKSVASTTTAAAGESGGDTAAARADDSGATTRAVVDVAIILARKSLLLSAAGVLVVVVVVAVRAVDNSEDFCFFCRIMVMEKAEATTKPPRRLSPPSSIQSLCRPFSDSSSVFPGQSKPGCIRIFSRLVVVDTKDHIKSRRGTTTPIMASRWHDDLVMLSSLRWFSRT